MDVSVDYNSGDGLFCDGEEVFLNRCTEEVCRHEHAHDFIEIAYVFAGKGLHLIGGKVYEVAKGDLFVINRDEPHEFRSVPKLSESGLQVYNCIFRPQFLDSSLVRSRCFSDLSHIFLFGSLAEEGADRDIHLLGRDNPEIGELYEKMYREYAMKCYGYVDMLRAQIVQLIVLIFRAYRTGGEADFKAREKRYFDDVIRFMKEHYSEEIKLEELAAMSFLSRSYFCASFKKCTGMTVLEYIQSLRIGEACAMLRDSDRKVVDIAQQVGYSDLKFFNRLFKANTGKTPSEYRRVSRPVKPL